MKAGIHPVYEPTRIVCVCGNVIETRSTMGEKEVHVEICAACHPFYTGKQKLVDKAGRVERFRRRYEKAGASKKAAAKTAAPEADDAAAAAPETEEPAAVVEPAADVTPKADEKPSEPAAS